MNGRIRNPWVVVAAYNEAPVVGSVVSGIRRAGYAVVVVDDGSGDRTGDVALLAGAVVVRHPINLGQGAALQTGIDYALEQRADALVTFDADGQHSPRPSPRCSRRSSSPASISRSAAAFSSVRPQICRCRAASYSAPRSGSRARAPGCRSPIPTMAYGR
ncbi:glycosyltransferase family 2 protein [Bradyrhizobium sp. BR 1432]|uniref:glycosyltransferase family 2 protein n=1 Tax=Bradyrhizobium sp. BR 1432 TaxID=3447966 RepID=UPI003EE6BD59